MNASAPMDRGALAPIFGDEPQYREPPSNQEAEQGLLGAIMLHDSVLEAVSDIVTGEDFYIPVHGRIFEAAQEVSASGRRADPVTLKAHFDGDTTLSKVGGAGYLATLAASSRVSGPLLAKDYAREIADCALRRRLIETMEDAIEAAWAGPGGETLAEALESQLFDLRRNASSSEAADAVSAFDDMVRQANGYASGEIELVDTGLSELDRIIIGMAPGDVTILAGRPGMGKSAAAQAIEDHNARQGRPIGWMQFEMTRAQMMSRAVSRITGIPAKPIQFGRLDPGDWEAVSRARATIAKHPVYIDDRRGVHVDQLIPRARRMVRRRGIKLLIIDHMGLVRFNAARRYEGVTEVSHRIKELAGTLGIPVLLLVQLNRGVESNERRKDRRPNMADLRDAGATEEDADNIIFVHREEYYLAREEPDRNDYDAHIEWEKAMAPIRGRAALIVAKQRFGEPGTAHCAFHGPTTTFKDNDRGML